MPRFNYCAELQSNAARFFHKTVTYIKDSAVVQDALYLLTAALPIEGEVGDALRMAAQMFLEDLQQARSANQVGQQSSRANSEVDEEQSRPHYGFSAV